MKLSQEAILEFQDIYERKHGVRLSTEDAQIKAVELLQFYSLSQGYDLSYDE